MARALCRQPRCPPPPRAKRCPLWPSRSARPAGAGPLTCLPFLPASLMGCLGRRGGHQVGQPVWLGQPNRLLLVLVSGGGGPTLVSLHGLLAAAPRSRAEQLEPARGLPGSPTCAPTPATPASQLRHWCAAGSRMAAGRALLWPSLHRGPCCLACAAPARRAFAAHGTCRPRNQPSQLFLAAIESFSKLADSIYFQHMPEEGAEAAPAALSTSGVGSASSKPTAGAGLVAAAPAAAAAAALQSPASSLPASDFPLPQLWVNQLASSSVRWSELRLVVHQDAGECLCGVGGGAGRSKPGWRLQHDRGAPQLAPRCWPVMGAPPAPPDLLAPPLVWRPARSPLLSGPYLGTASLQTSMGRRPPAWPACASISTRPTKRRWSFTPPPPRRRRAWAGRPAALCCTGGFPGAWRARRAGARAALPPGHSCACDCPRRASAGALLNLLEHPSALPCPAARCAAGPSQTASGCASTARTPQSACSSGRPRRRRRPVRAAGTAPRVGGGAAGAASGD